jgi:hypothetical protein
MFVTQGLSNLGIATCMPKINSAKQRMWRMDILLVLFGVSFSDAKDGISIPLFYLLSVDNMDFSDLSFAHDHT